MPLHPLPPLSNAVVEGTENEVSFLAVKRTALKYPAIVDCEEWSSIVKMGAQLIGCEKPLQVPR
jgi:hypothetical protein